MSFEPLLDASMTVQVHLMFALLALVLGPVALWRKRRDRVHKMVGYVWVSAMIGAAVSALFLRSAFSPVFFGPIHLLSFFVFWSLWDAIRAIRRGDVRRHAEEMRSLFSRGLVLAGGLAFLPGRVLNEAVFPNVPLLGVGVSCAAAVWAFAPLVRRRISRGRVGRRDGRVRGAQSAGARMVKRAG
jgi:uncharacterized membrane protein